jgi:hypothetical protein
MKTGPGRCESLAGLILSYRTRKAPWMTNISSGESTVCTSVAGGLYLAAIALAVLGLTIDVGVHGASLVSGGGFGSFSVLWTGVYVCLTVVLWMSALLLMRDWKRTLVYWFVVLVAVVLHFAFGVQFYSGE